MNRIFKTAIIIFSALCGIVLTAAAVLYIISPSSAGRDISFRKGLPYHMVVAHRGASYYAPENTAPAFIIAGELGADYLECDVQRTKDGRLIIFHDKTPERTTDVSEIFPGREKAPVGSFTYSELMRLDAGTWFNMKNPERARESFRSTRICTFREYVDIAERCGKKPGLMIELKHPELYPGIEKEVIDLLAERGRIDNGSVRPDMIQTFDRKSLARCKELAPSIHRNFLVDEEGKEDTEWDERGWEGLLDDAVTAGSEIGPSGYLGWPWYTGSAHDRGLLVITYTIDRDIHFRMLTFFGTDWIITNRCGRALEFYGRKPGISPEEVMKSHNL
ncbi:MAG TPA: glycerophosphodiester phosphodiesterase family protein [Spirochaetota bacterium]|nr:glycerophosphodiester phosphodiesterase family protein [Spirochaetota bacterium]HPJ35210.1 glycerophosphodiester phosphodiesterase family protein [Spirochaetota bacterium]